MNNDKLIELEEKYKNRNLMEELSWGAYYNHQGYTYKLQAEFLNWLCYTAYKRIKELERPQGEWEDHNSYYKRCSHCQKIVGFDYILQDGEVFNFCPNCGAEMKVGAE